MPLSANLFPLLSSIQKHLRPGGEALGEGCRVRIFFFRKKKFLNVLFFSWNRLKRTQIFFRWNGTKKKMLVIFFTFFTFKIDHISKTKNQNFFFFGFSFFSKHNASLPILKSPLKIIKSKRLFSIGTRNYHKKWH